MKIKEFLPNPIGSDKEGEYIKILNDSDNAVSLIGWQIKDASGKAFNLTGDLRIGEELILPYSQTKIFINNNGEEISLFNSTGELVDKLNYSGIAEEGQIITRIMPVQAGELGMMEIENGSPTSSVVFTAILIAAILAGIGVYIILQLEKKLEIKLW